MVEGEGQPDQPQRRVRRQAAQEENEQPVPDQDQEVQERVQEEDLENGPHHVIMLFIPVTLCMAFTIISVAFFTRDERVFNTSGLYHPLVYKYLVYIPFLKKSDSVAIAIAIAGIMLGAIAVYTVLLNVAYKLRWYWLIRGWFFLSSLKLLSVFIFIYLTHFLKEYNLPLDYISLAIIIWNFEVIGNFVIIPKFGRT